MPGSEGNSTATSVGSQLAQLAPTFDPGVDSVEQWRQKIRLLIRAWPENLLNELATRIILNTKGSAFQKLELLQNEVTTGTKEGILDCRDCVRPIWPS